MLRQAPGDVRTLLTEVTIRIVIVTMIVRMISKWRILPAIVAGDPKRYYESVG